MDKALQTLAKSFLPEGVTLSSRTVCSGSGKTLTIDRADREDTIIRLELSEWKVWPHGQKSCDCLVLCKKKDCKKFVALLVELKGDDTKSAYVQIENTAAMLCKKDGLAMAGHVKAGAATAVCKSVHGHEGKLVAVIVAPGEGNGRGLYQKKVRYLAKKKILLLPIRRPGIPLTIDFLYEEAFAET